MKNLIFSLCLFIFVSVIYWSPSLAMSSVKAEDTHYDLTTEILFKGEGFGILKLSDFPGFTGNMIVLVDSENHEVYSLANNLSQVTESPLEEEGPGITGCNKVWSGGFCLWHTYYCWYRLTWPCTNMWFEACGCC